MGGGVGGGDILAFIRLQVPHCSLSEQHGRTFHFAEYNCIFDLSKDLQENRNVTLAAILAR